MTAVNLIGASLTSEVSYYQCADIPDAPLATVLESTTETSISVAWNEPVNNGGTPISGYRLYMNDILADDVFHLTYDGSNYPSTVSYTATSLTAGRYYRFRVIAINKNGESVHSPDDMFLAADFPSSPSQPFLISSTPTTVTFGWYPSVDDGGAQFLGY